MTGDEVVTLLQPWVRQHVRTAWVPKIDGASPGTANGSRFGGAPWIPEGERPPECGHCHQPLRLLVQLDLATLPEGARGKLPASGLLQAFYCEEQDCESEAEGYLPFSEIHLVRVIPASPGAVQVYGNAFPVKAISGWTAKEDFPSATEQDEQGLELVYDFLSRKVVVKCPAVKLESEPIPMDQLEAEQISQALAGDKLRGWPHWIQGVEYPECTRCRRKMEVVFQIDSEVNVPHMWGDAGIAHLSQCADHPEVMTMGWACS